MMGVLMSYLSKSSQNWVGSCDYIKDKFPSDELSYQDHHHWTLDTSVGGSISSALYAFNIQKIMTPILSCFTIKCRFITTYFNRMSTVCRSQFTIQSLQIVVCPHYLAVHYCVKVAVNSTIQNQMAQSVMFCLLCLCCV